MKRLNILALSLVVVPLSWVDAGTAWGATVAKPPLVKDAQGASTAGKAAAPAANRARQAAKKIPPRKNLARTPTTSAAPASVAQAPAWTPPVFTPPAWPVAQPAPVVYAPSNNPYLAYRQAALTPPAPQPSVPVSMPAMPAMPVMPRQAVPATSFTPPAPFPAPVPFPAPAPVSAPVPYMAPVTAPSAPSAGFEDIATSTHTPNPLARYFSGFQLISPVRPPRDQSILPTFKKVYPTGEKPLVAVTFKCPTELVGITPLPTKALHGLVDLGMGALNSSNLLSFNLQQVCQ